MATTVSCVESIGPPPGSSRAADFVHVLQDDAFSVGELGFTVSPILPRLDGGPSYSMERWLRFKFAQPFTQVFDFKFWMPDLDVRPGWTFSYGTTTSYQQPSNGPSAIATGPVPMTLPLEPNAGGVTPLNGDQERYSDWIVIQAIVNGDALVGPMQGFGADHAPKPLQYRFNWTEL